MEAGQRDFVIERLEKQLLQKTEEVEQIKNTLRDSIIHELRDDLLSDLEINKRLMRLEQKVQELANNVSGVMDELLDQKSMIQKIKNPEKEDSSQIKSRQHTGINDGFFNRREPPESAVRIKPKEPIMPAPKKPGRTMSFSIRDINEDVQDDAPEPEIETKDDLLIVPENKSISDKCNGQAENYDCEYIIADERSHTRKKQETEFETVESRDDEDTVITITHRK
ncbi:hypothetical protein [Methanohalophilus sp.]|uniref:hypothetical protein n=1 Tax=Methanohalophilus sp. TaxID=1966352 RepID=UPI00262E6D19|nr:hypothetical protein [Methanohalophilus sp.]MDK2891750.1 hypothetical protein [Methanohalophilus sp.]